MNKNWVTERVYSILKNDKEEISLYGINGYRNVESKNIVAFKDITQKNYIVMDDDTGMLMPTYFATLEDIEIFIDYIDLICWCYHQLKDGRKSYRMLKKLRKQCIKNDNVAINFYRIL